MCGGSPPIGARKDLSSPSLDPDTALPVHLTPSDCSTATGGENVEIRPAGVSCHLWNDNLFAQLRQAVGVQANFLNDGWSFSSLRNGTGKGGGKMAFIGTSYIVKELSRDDHQTLLAITESYAEHLLKGNSLLCLILLHFTDPQTGKHYHAMRNEVGKGPFQALYDLKGCADDKALVFNGRKINPVHKRFWKVHLWCGRCAWSHARYAYYYGKVMAAEAEFVISEERRSLIAHLVQCDTNWLESHGLMDYSLLVALKMSDHVGEKKNVDKVALSEQGREIDEDSTLSLAIIDFLQRWSLKKRVAQSAKACEENKATVPPDVYARRFRMHFEERFVCEDVAGPSTKQQPLMVASHLTNALPTPDLLGNRSAANYDSLAEETFG